METSASSLQLEEQGKSMGGRLIFLGVMRGFCLFACFFLKRMSVENCYRSDINDIFFSDKLWSRVLYFQRSSVWVKEQLENGMLRALCEYFSRCNQDKYQPVRCHFYLPFLCRNGQVCCLQKLELKSPSQWNNEENGVWKSFFCPKIFQNSIET